MQRCLRLIIFYCFIVSFSIHAAGDESTAFSSGNREQDFRWASTPTDRDLRAEAELLEIQPSPDYSKLMRPRWTLAAEWEPESDGLAVTDYDLRVSVPTYPFYGPPPPMITAGFSYTCLDWSNRTDLPSSLYDFNLGATWMRPLNDRWMVRFMASAAFASDLENTSSDAWQFRGGVFATYRCNANLQFLIGAFASGRADIPVLPGIGAIWTPRPDLHLNLMMPRPRASFMIADHGIRQHWIFLTGGLSGGTWAFRADNTDDRITYREWRVGLGWEITPPKSFPPMPASGMRLETELGYIFGREFEFDRGADALDVSDTMLLRASVSF